MPSKYGHLLLDIVSIFSFKVITYTEVLKKSFDIKTVF